MSAVVDAWSVLDPLIRDPHSGEVVGRDEEITRVRAALIRLIEKADNAAMIMCNCIEAGQIGEGYRQNADDLRVALSAFPRVPNER